MKKPVIEHLVRVLEENSLTLFTNRRKFTPSRGRTRLSTQRLSRERPKTFPSRAEALAEGHGVKLGLRTMEGRKGHSLTIVGKDKEKEFRGALAFNRIQYIPVGRLGGDTVSLDWYITEEAIHFVVDSGTYARWLHSGSVAGTRVPPEWWESRALSDQFINLTGHLSAPRSRRFFECVLKLHTETYALCKAFRKDYPQEIKQVSLLLRMMIINIMKEGKCESTLVEVFKSAVEVIHHDNIENRLEETIRKWPGPLKVSVFRLRRSMYSDTYSTEVLQEQTLARLQKAPLVLTPRGEQMLQYWQKMFSSWIHKNPGKVLECHKVDLHKSSASFLSLRSEGGGSRELHLVVALHRLHLGRESPLCDVFGQLSSKETVKTLAEKHSRLPHEEIVAACTWWCKLIEERDWPLGMMIAIFPEREPKGRTFTVPWVAAEILASPATRLVKYFLTEQPECARMCVGNDDQYRLMLHRAKQTGQMRMDLDSSQATDHYGHILVNEFYKPALAVLPEFVSVGVHLSGKRGKISIAKGRSKLLDSVTNLVWSQQEHTREDQQKSIPAYPSSRRLLKPYTKTSSRKLRITDHEGRIISQALRGPFILKSFPGAGKTTWLADQRSVVISLPSIAQCVMLKQSLDGAGIEAHCYWSGLERPNKKSTVPIICTPAHVVSLLRENAERWYVCDEADTPMESPLIAFNWCLKLGKFAIACSATPEQLQLPLPTLELLGVSDHPVKDRSIQEGELAADVRSVLERCDQQVMVVVHSEPRALYWEKLLTAKGLKARALLSAHDDDEIVEVMRAKIVVATNKVRSSINLPDLYIVYDFGARYQYIVDSASFVVVGVITRVSPADEGQLRGRVGRVGPGEYVRVESSICCSPSIVLLHDVEESARLNKELDIGLLPIPYSAGSMNKNIITTALCSAHLEKNLFTRGLPAPVRFLQKVQLLDGIRARLGLMFCFESFGFRQRLLELSRTQDPELSVLLTSFDRNLAGDDFTHAYLKVFQAFIEHRLYHRETAMACRWLKLEHSVPGLERHLDAVRAWDSRSARAILVTLLWDAVVTTKGNEYHGVIAGYRCPKGGTDPEKALLLSREVDMQTGVVTYARALQLEHEIELLQELYAQATENLDVTYCVPNFQHTFVHLNKSKHRPFLMVTSMPPDSLLVAQPAQLPALLKTIEENIEAATRKFANTTSGINMASRISPRMLLGLCWLSGIYAQKSIPDLLFEVFGDDFAACAKERADLLKYVSELRGEFGMVTKPSASAEQRLKETLTVVTERFFDGTGQEVEGIKPSSFIKLFLSQNNDWSMIGTGLERTDFIGDFNALKSKFPDSISELGLRDPSSSNRRRRRVTHSRSLARQILSKEAKADVHSLGYAQPKRVEDLVSEVENLILAISPSTRGEGKVQESNTDAQAYSSFPQSTLTRISRHLDSLTGGKTR